MGANVWAVVGGSTFQLPMESLLGTAYQLLGMNAAATMLQYKDAKFNNATGQLSVPIGAVGAPGYAFDGDLDSGFYMEAANQLAIATGGTRRASWRSTENLIAINIPARIVSGLVQEDQGADISAAATTDLGNATGNTLNVTNAAGNTVVTSLGGATIPAGTEVETRFSITGGSVTLTHNATSLDLLGSADIILVDRDIARFRKTNDASAYWKMVSFQRGLASTPFTAKGDLLVGKQVGALIQQSVKPRGANDTVLVSDDTQDDGTRWGSIASPPIRQTILAAALTAAGACNILSAGAALNYNIAATTVPALLTFAGGFNAGGQVDSFTYLSADLANQGSLAASNTNYIYFDRASATTITPGSCLIPPQDGHAFDRSQGAILNFEGADTSTTIIDDFGNSWSVGGNAQIDTAQFKFGSSSLLCDGTGDYVSSTNITTFGDGSWEASVWFRLNANGILQSIMQGYNAAGFGWAVQVSAANKILMYASSNGSSWNVASAVTGATTINTATWYKVRYVFDALAGTYRVYLSVNGAAESQETTTSSTARICQWTTTRCGIDSAGASGLNGWLDAFRIIRAATVTGTQTPAAAAPAITDYLTHFFSIPEMKMYEVSAASVTAGVNPTMIARNRLFVGEQDTNAGAVTATRNYAIRGLYIGLPVTYAAGTPIPFNHNIGTDLVEVIARGTAHESLGQPAGYYEPWRAYYWNGAANEQRGFTIGAVRRCTASIYPGVTNASLLGDDASLIQAQLLQATVRRLY